MDTPKDTFSFSIDLPVRNEWANIDLLRTSVQNCFTAVFADVDGCHAIAMVTGELLENALKYGNWSAGRRSMFRLRVHGDSGQIEVSVQNPVGAADDPGVGELLRTLRWLESFPQAEAAYRERMLQIAEVADDQQPSRLGLARIAYEGNCRLSAKVDGLTLTVTAHFDLPRPAGAVAG